MKPGIPRDVIFTASGTRGIVGDEHGLTPSFIVPLGMAYGSWIRKRVGKRPRIIVGRDTRPSGPMLETGIVHALLATGCYVFSAGICPTPAIVHAKRVHGFDGAVIISASHNPAEYNGFKFLSPEVPGTFLSNEELDELYSILTNPSTFYNSEWTEPGTLETIDILGGYIADIKDFIISVVPESLPFKVVIDSGGGCASTSVVPLLRELGCKVISINDSLLDHAPFFPRDSEPVEANLGMLAKTVVSEHADVGMGVDCDADRISICDEKGNILREDVGLGLLMKNLPAIIKDASSLLIVTNVASSLMFEDIAKASGGSVVRTPIGERYLAVKMHELANENGFQATKNIVVGGEGSCGGIMMPRINIARDASLAAACLVAILHARRDPVSFLVSELPVYHLEKIKVDVKGKSTELVMKSLMEKQKPGTFTTIMNDIKFSGPDWWVLIHPSNTEPIIRILVEAKEKKTAIELLEKYQEELESVLRVS